MLEETTRIKVLIVEDDSSLGYLLCENFKTVGIVSSLTNNGNKAIEVLKKEQFDICILDIMLPEKDGFAVASFINDRKAEIPFIFLTALSLDADKHYGFEIGADDYITKPFNFKELYYRVLAVTRRRKYVAVATRTAIIEMGPLLFNPSIRELRINNNIKKISHREASLLHTLLQSNGGYVNRYEILNQVWGSDNSLAARSMEVYITRLRKLLKEAPGIEIENLYGEGYRIVFNKI